MPYASFCTVMFALVRLAVTADVLCKDSVVVAGAV